MHEFMWYKINIERPNSDLDTNLEEVNNPSTSSDIAEIDKDNGES